MVVDYNYMEEKKEEGEEEKRERRDTSERVQVV